MNTPVGKIEKKSKWFGTQVFVRIDAAELNQHKYGLWLETDEVIEQSFLELAAKAVRELKSGQLLVLDVRGFDAYQGKKDLGSLGDMLHAEVFRATTKAHPFFVVVLCASRHLAYGFRNAHIGLHDPDDHEQPIYLWAQEESEVDTIQDKTSSIFPAKGLVSTKSERAMSLAYKMLYPRMFLSLSFLFGLTSGVISIFGLVFTNRAIFGFYLIISVLTLIVVKVLSAILKGPIQRYCIKTLGITDSDYQEAFRQIFEPKSKKTRSYSAKRILAELEKDFGFLRS